MTIRHRCILISKKFPRFGKNVSNLINLKNLQNFLPSLCKSTATKQITTKPSKKGDR